MTICVAVKDEARRVTVIAADSMVSWGSRADDRVQAQGYEKWRQLPGGSWVAAAGRLGLASYASRYFRSLKKDPSELDDVEMEELWHDFFIWGREMGLVDAGCGHICGSILVADRAGRIWNTDGNGDSIQNPYHGIIGSGSDVAAGAFWMMKNATEQEYDPHLQAGYMVQAAIEFMTDCGGPVMIEEVAWA